ncbi:MAG: NADH:ubiquinone reductase (Na(+)-transporting) subunit B [Candidatus Marinimicrobia bacterium]|nr:NADH:ubiquinone reductase (Na(+)-transporting) subunit B [Candidatus Neomarinimicrobiota bacterium]
MQFLRRFSERMKPAFEEEGRLKLFYPVYEMLDTLLFNTDKETDTAPYIRDSVDLKRIMTIVIFALLPVFFFGLFNIGYQQALAFGLERGLVANLWFGLKVMLPIIIVSYATGAVWEVLFAIIRKHEVDEGFLVTGLLIPMIIPPTIPLWQVAVATSFGMVIGKLVFGGTGMNIFNPALTTRAFLFFAYPGKISGDSVWALGPDGYSGATPLAVPAAVTNGNAVELLNGVTQFDYSWSNMFYGLIPGSISETSALAILIGAIFLILTKIGSWRVIVGGLLGLAGTALLTNILAGQSSNTMLSLPPHYHLVMGGFLFGITFMATDPVTAAHTNAGRWIYGIMIGVLTVVIRSINPAYPEGTMLAILLMNAFAPLIDYFVVQANIKKRVARYAQ